MFVTTYDENRFQFFDLFVKRGLGFLLMIVALTIWLALTLPLVGPLATTWAAPWIFVITLLPVATAIPWLYTRSAALLDRIGCLRSATNQAQLCAQATRGLGEIFSASAEVVLGDGTPPSEDARRVIAVRSGEDVIGRFVMGPRTGEVAPTTGGHGEITLTDGSKHEVSRRRFKELTEKLAN